MTKTIELYNILKDKIGNEGSMAIVEALEDVSVKVKAEAATKADLELLETRLSNNLELLETNLTNKIDNEIKAIRSDMKLHFIVLLFVILLTNPKAIDLLAKLLGIFK
ncbi:MAG: hypothetical protein HQK96_15330 [Nitrospirae bacterium]|nr:hypothetical protein [Nitrospirota bacterium]